MKRTAFVLLCVLLPGTVRAQEAPSMRWPVRIVLGAGAFDVLTTQHNLAIGSQEENPIVPTNRVGNAIVLGGGYALNAYLLHRFGPKHPRIAWTVATVTASFATLCAARNFERGIR